MEKILIIDFGSQYTQLIARRIREMQVYCEIVPFNKYSPGLLAGDVRGVVLSGSPCSVASPDAPRIDLSGKDVIRKLVIHAREAGYAV